MIEWIAVDWGSSNLRIWAMNAQGGVVQEKQIPQCTNTLSRAQFEPALLRHIQDWLPLTRTMPVVVCGVVGSRQGWQETPYSPVPTVPPQHAIKVNTRDARLDVRILFGIKQDQPADVMRGEETQIAGFLSEEPHFEGAVCLPGTHSKWAQISAGQVRRFQTVLTGEVFALLSQQSILSHSMGVWSDTVFVENVGKTMQAPEQALAALFHIRANALLHHAPHGIAHLSAVLIGTELAGTKAYWQAQRVKIIGAHELARLYALALQTQLADVSVMCASSLTLAGLKLAWQEIFA